MGVGEKHCSVGADSWLGSMAAGRGSTLGQGILCPVAEPKLGRLAGNWAAVVGNRPKSDLGNRKLFLLQKTIYTLELIRFKFKFKLPTIPIRKIKYKCTSSHSKICSSMNATNTIIYLHK
jgi:hypothetical protein